LAPTISPIAASTSEKRGLKKMILNNKKAMSNKDLIKLMQIAITIIAIYLILKGLGIIK